jgi:hypothetical protein
LDVIKVLSGWCITILHAFAIPNNLQFIIMFPNIIIRCINHQVEDGKGTYRTRTITVVFTKTGPRMRVGQRLLYA